MLKRPLALAPAFLAATLLAQSGEIAPNENLVTSGIPVIPTAIADAVGRYADFRAASFQTWHPVRREMLVLTRFGDTNQVHRVRMPGGDRTHLTFFPDRVSSASFPPRAPATSSSSARTWAGASSSSSTATTWKRGRSPSSPTASRATWGAPGRPPGTARPTPPRVATARTDPRVPWTESEQMVAALKKEGRPFQLYATVAFVKLYLLN